MKKDIFNLTIKLGVMFIIITTLFAVTYYQNADLAKELLEVYIPTLESMMESDGSISWFKLFQNNLFACAQTLGMGIVPLFYLPMFVLISNSIMTGAVFGLATAEAGMDPIKSLVFGILPHGIFELTGLFLSVALGIYLCKNVGRIITRRAGDTKLLDVLNAVAKGFVLIVIPLITIASLIECYITPALIEWAAM